MNAITETKTNKGLIPYLINVDRRFKKSMKIGLGVSGKTMRRLRIEAKRKAA